MELATVFFFFFKKYRFYESFKYIVDVHAFVGDLQLVRKIFIRLIRNTFFIDLKFSHILAQS